MNQPGWFREHVVKRATRSSKWSSFAKEVIKDHPYCSSCGDTRQLHVHHIKPFHLYPELELEKDNVIVLCMKFKCHFIVGHLKNWKSWNNHVKEMAQNTLQMIKLRP